ncbi:MAG TPA: sugar ABC transporter permease [Pseudonocardiaceae bacterium]|nr:sugar ABC transporter permease [Pseudonocardiaceae bacterium]
MATPVLTAAAGPAPAASRRGRRRARRRESLAGLLFVSPAILMLVLFLLVPILMAFWVSLTKWTGQGSPFTPGVPFAGGSNYADLFVRNGLERTDFMTSVRNILYYVLLVVPLQTALALGLALVVNRRRMVGRTFFRTAFYFPSVTSSVAISIVFLFMFTGGGAINAVLSVFGIRGPAWFSDADGIVHLLLSRLGLHTPPAALTSHGLLGLSWWEWLSGPSVAMCAIIALVVWTTSGTFMLMFLAALQDIPAEVVESSMLDGASRRQRLRYVILPMLRPTMFLVLTLGLIGSWQVFDQIFVMSKGGPDKTTLSPAYVSYTTGFADQNFPAAAAMAFVLFAIIVLMTLAQRRLLRERRSS